MWRMRLIGAAAAVLLAARLSPAQTVVAEPFLGVKLYSITQTTPRPNNIRILEIDLAQPGLSFRNTPRVPGLPNGDETITQTTRQYVNEQSAQIGINTSFFRLENGGQARPTNNLGILVSDGDRYSPWDATGEVGMNLSVANVVNFITAPSNRPTGFETNPSTVSLHNAVRGSHRLLNNGNNVAPADNATPGNFLHLHPRTAMGYTANNKLLLATIDGRRSGFSEGMHLREVANLLAGYGAIEAINLDGGGSTTMAMDYYGDGATRAQLINTPSGSERYNGASLGVFAPRNPAFIPPTGLVPVPPPPGNIRVLEDFEDGNGTFYTDPDFSGSNRGLLEISDGVGPSSAQRDANHYGRGFASQRINIVSQDDPTWDGFRLRHLSGQGNPANNQHIGASGYIGFMMRTLTPGLTAAVALDENLGTAIEMGTPQALIADGNWHLYQWNLADAGEWENFTSSANGEINGPVMTVDSIIISSLIDQDATVWLDAVQYNPDGPLVPEPSGVMMSLALAGLMALRRRHAIQPNGFRPNSMPS